MTSVMDARLSLHVCRRSLMSAIACMVAFIGLVGCGDTDRTATNFCRQLEKELPGMGTPPVTQSDVDVLLSRYRRIGEVAPIAVSADWETLTVMLEDASRLNTANSEDVEAFTKEALQANKAAARALQWVKDTCGVDLSGFPPASQ
ncbi:MAG: hypothetical protein EBV24_04270 [Actinobacteria bacterium]|jgi:hypothetical protein|nr:hypothetical protein [Actinomycetota bacterium]